jgi:hypothetical protein
MRVGKRLLPLTPPRRRRSASATVSAPPGPLHRSETNIIQAAMLEKRWARCKDDLNWMALVVCHVIHFGDSIQEAVRVFPFLSLAQLSLIYLKSYLTHIA